MNALSQGAWGQQDEVMYDEFAKVLNTFSDRRLSFEPSLANHPAWGQIETAFRAQAGEIDLEVLYLKDT